MLASFFFFFSFFWLPSWHMEVPRLVANWSYSCWSTLQPQQRRIWATSSTYTTAHGNAGSLTHWVRPRIESASLWMLVGFVNCWVPTGTPCVLFFCFLFCFVFDREAVDLLRERERVGAISEGERLSFCIFGSEDRPLFCPCTCLMVWLDLEYWVGNNFPS